MRNKVHLPKLIAAVLAGCLLVAGLVGAGPAAANGGGMPQIQMLWTLPDDDSSAPGTQIMPDPGMSKSFSCWITVTGDKTQVDSLDVEVYHPDGTLKCTLSATLTDPSTVTPDLDAARDTGLITAAQREAIGNGEVLLYLALSDDFACDLQFYDAPGIYGVTSRITYTNSTQGAYTRNSFEYYGLVAFVLDFAGLDFGHTNTTPATLPTLGDADMSTPAKPTVRNIGNVPCLFTLSADPMVGAAHGQEIKPLDIDFMGEQKAIDVADVAFANPLVQSLDSTPSTAPLSASIDIPAGQQADTYNGKLTISASAPQPEETAEVELQMTLQGAHRPVDAGWIVPVTARLFERPLGGDADVLNDEPVYAFMGASEYDVVLARATFTRAGIAPGAYDIAIVSEHALLNVMRDVNIAAGPNNMLDMGTLLEGDADNNGTIDSLDFAILQAAFMTSDLAADFDRNGIVDISDYNLLAVNFMKASPVAVP
ncbi:MAG: hypothetical protein PHV74_07665 [Dehalococcoidia bacterium]|nr:hypothetical protein [Dehalococcoidia bacterium]